MSKTLNILALAACVAAFGGGVALAQSTSAGAMKKDDHMSSGAMPSGKKDDNMSSGAMSSGMKDDHMSSGAMSSGGKMKSKKAKAKADRMSSGAMSSGPKS